MSQSGTKVNNEDEKTDAGKSKTDEENKSKLIEHSVEKAIEPVSYTHLTLPTKA